MATIVPNAGATFNGSTVEAQLWQLFNWLQMHELSTASNPNRMNFVSGTKDTETQVFSGNWRLLARQTRQTDGSLKIEGVPHLNIPADAFTIGTPGGTFKADNWASLGLEIIAYAIELQNAANLTPKVTATYQASTETGESVGAYSGVFRLPYQSVLGGAGSTIDTPTEWL